MYILSCYGRDSKVNSELVSLLRRGIRVASSADPEITGSIA